MSPAEMRRSSEESASLCVFPFFGSVFIVIFSLVLCCFIKLLLFFCFFDGVLCLPVAFEKKAFFI